MRVYDSYKYIKKLVSTGVPEKQAEIYTEQIKEILESNLATKQDIAEIHSKYIKKLVSEGVLVF